MLHNLNTTKSDFKFILGLPRVFEMETTDDSVVVGDMLEFREYVGDFDSGSDWNYTGRIRIFEILEIVENIQDGVKILVEAKLELRSDL